MDNNQLYLSLLNENYPMFSTLLENELDIHQYTYKNYSTETNSQYKASKTIFYPVRAIMLALTLKNKDERFFNTLIEHHKRFDNINVYELDEKHQNILFNTRSIDVMKDLIDAGMNSKLKNKE